MTSKQQRCLDAAVIDSSKDLVRVLVFNTTFNNITVISWRSVLLVGETGEDL